MKTSRKQHQPNPAPETDKNVDLNEVLYDRFAEKTRSLFEQGQEKSAEAWEKAMELAHKQMTAAGEFSVEQGNAFKRYLSRDLAHTAADMNQLAKHAKVTLHPARLGAGALSSMAKLLQIGGDMLSSLSTKAESALVYQSGEITMAGTLTCSGCGNKVQLKKTSVVPTCPSCQGTQFRKGY